MKSLATMFATLLVAAAPEETGDKAKIQGGWYTHQMNNDGNEIGVGGSSDPSAVFMADGRLRLYGEDIARYSIDDTKKSIDIAVEKGFDAGTTSLGIYKIEGNTLTISYVDPPGKRPTDFTPGAGRFLTVYRRTPKKAVTAEPTGEMYGLWELVEQIESGIKREIADKSLLAFRGDVFVHEDTEGVYSGHFTFDARAKPKTIDMTAEGGRIPANAHRLGIYKIEGNTLTVCHVESPGKRPTDFTPGAGRSLTVYRRTPKKR